VKVWKVIRNVLLGAVALVLLLLVVLQVVLRPAVLTGIVNRIAADYVQGDVSFRQVKAHVIKSFPYLNVEAEDLVITYPHNRYARYDTVYASVQEPLLQAGRHPEADTLVSLKGLELSINYRDLARGAYNIRRAELRHPRIFAHYYDSTAANWNILPIGPSEGESKPLPSIRVHRVLLSRDPLIVYTNPADTLFGQFTMVRLGLEGEIHSLEPGQIRARLEADTLAVSGRLPSDTLAFRLDRLRAGADRRHFTLEADAHASLQTGRYGRFLLPVSLEAEGDVPEREDEAVEVDLERLGLRLASLEVTGDGQIVKRPEAWDMDVNARAKDAPLGELISTFQENFPALKKWKTDAVLSLDAHAKGTYGGGSVPVITASLLVPDAALDHESLGRSGRISLDADIRTDNLNRVDADIRRLLFDIVGAHIDASGSALDFLGKDPQFVLDADILARLDSLTHAFTRERGISGTGSIRAGLHGKVRMSQLNVQSIGKADVDCHLQAENLSVEDAPDSLSAYFRRVNAHLATQKGTTLSLKALFDTLDVTYKKDIYVRGTALDAALTPLSGQFRLSSLELRDDEGLTVAVQDNAESFRMTPASEGQSVPRYYITSGSGLVHVMSGADSYILDSLRLSVAASRHQARERQEGGRRPAPDSLRRARRPRQQQDDFSSADISISLSQALTQYVRDWDFSGRVGLDEGLLMMPAFPLLTRVSSLQGTLDNNTLDLERVTVQAGVSDITAKAKLTGLRRALLSRGRRAPLKLDATVQSEYIDANELMRAYAYYTTYRPEGEETAVSFEALDTIRNPSKVLALPSNLDLTLQLEGTGLKYDSLLVNWLAADVAMRNRTLQVTNMVASSNMGDIYFEGFYATRSKQDIKAGFDLNLVDITAEKVITLFPAVDTIMPMLTSFAGDLDCELAATTEIDTCMNLVLPSVDGIMKISGKDLSLMESEEFTRMARKLMFRNQEEARIDNMAVTGMVRDNLLEVFPFILDVDRYLFAASGVQNLDRGFDYHISVIRSPLLLKFGVNAWGETFDNVHYDVTKAKYRSTNLPVFTKQLDTVQYSLLAAIHNIFELGVEKALAENNSRQVLQSQADEIPEREAPPVDLDSESMRRISVLYEDVTERLARRREALKQEVLELEEALAVRNKEEEDEQ